MEMTESQIRDSSKRFEVLEMMQGVSESRSNADVDNFKQRRK